MHERKGLKNETWILLLDEKDLPFMICSAFVKKKKKTHVHQAVTMKERKKSNNTVTCRLPLHCWLMLYLMYVEPFPQQISDMSQHKYN